MFSLRNLSSLIFKKPSGILKEINSNALMDEWLRNNPSPQIFDTREDLYLYVNNTICENKPVYFLEFGVAHGDSILRWAEINDNDSSVFFGFDTFEGLPEPFDRIRYTDPVGQFSAEGNFPKTDDVRVEFIKGLFQDTLTDFLSNYQPQNRLIIHNDSDLYTSSLFILTSLNSILRPGTILIFDEFFCSSHEFQAFYDYVASYRKSFSVLAATQHGTKRYVQVAIMME